MRKIQSKFVICFEEIIYLLLHNLHDCAFKCICSRLFTAYIFTNIFANIFSKREKPIAFYKYSISTFCRLTSHFSYVTHQLITKVNYISIYEYSELKVFKYIYINLVEISNSWPNHVIGTNLYKTLESCWYSLLAILH